MVSPTEIASSALYLTKPEQCINKIVYSIPINDLYTIQAHEYNLRDLKFCIMLPPCVAV